MKHFNLFVILMLLTLFFDCKNSKDKNANYRATTQADSSRRISGKADSAVIDTPVWGYRFTITGDFNGDGKKDTFIEHFYSTMLKREMNKFFTGNKDIYDLDKRCSDSGIISFMVCNHPEIDTLFVGGPIGPLFVKNEGDLDGDGGDEVSYVESAPQMSSITRYRVISYKHHKWVELFAFEIREWQLPPLPSAGRSYGLFGSDGMYIANDSENKSLEENLKTFDKLLKKRKDGKVAMQSFTSEAFDTTIVVDFRRIKKYRKAW